MRHRRRSTVRESGRSGIAIVAVAVLLVLVGVAVYGVLSVARGGGAAGGGASGPRGLTPSEALAQTEPMIVNGEWTNALATLLPAVERHPDEQALRLAVARVYSGQRDWPRSYAAYEVALAIGPESAPLQAEAGTVANAAGLLDRSIEHYTRAKALDVRDYRHPLYLAMVQLKSGGVGGGQDLEKAAMANLYIAAQLKPDLAEAWGVMGEVELRSNNLDMALQHLEKARTIQPASVKWRLAEAKVHKRRNEPVKAVELLINLPDAERYHEDVVGVVADSLSMLKQVQQRAEYVERAAAYWTAAGKPDVSGRIVAAWGKQ